MHDATAFGITLNLRVNTRKSKYYKINLAIIVIIEHGQRFTLNVIKAVETSYRKWGNSIII